MEQMQNQMEHQHSVPESKSLVSLAHHINGDLEGPLENIPKQFEGTLENNQIDCEKHLKNAIEEKNEIFGQTFEPPLTKRSVNTTQRRPTKIAPNSTTTSASDQGKETKYTPNTSPRSQSMEETILEESARCQYAILAAEANRRAEHIVVLRQVSLNSRVVQSKNCEYEINFVMLFGLFIGIVITKAFQYLLKYFAWFIEKVHEQRKALWGTSTIWEFLTKCDNERFSKSTKLLLLPLILVCGLLYGIISILQSMVRLLLNTAPWGLVKFVHQLHKSQED